MAPQAQWSSLGALEDPAREWLRRLRDGNVASRLGRRDSSLWADDAETRALIEQRLGWVGNAGATVDLESASGTVLLLGMGGSSLGADAAARAFGSDRLQIVDSTVPEAVRAAADLLPQVSDIVVASKSGGTLETIALADYFEVEARPGTRFHAVTDPGSNLAERARERGYTGLHLNAVDIGGRFSVLSMFGAVPLTLAGIDVASLYRHASEAATRCGVDGEDNPGLGLGAVVAAASSAGRDKMIVVAAPGLEGLADWIEQLVAESTGKHGKGIVPVVVPRDAELRAGDDRFVVELDWADGFRRANSDHPHSIPWLRRAIERPAGVGAEFYTWQVATAVVGHVLGINPFDEPDVASAKRRTREVLDRGETLAVDAGSPWQVVGGESGDLEGLAIARPGTYTGILGFLPQTPGTMAGLERLRSVLDLTGAATLGWGPRYLHSSGQLHKGGPAGARFVVITAAQDDLAVPGFEWSFDTIARAQAQGDVAALRAAGREVVHVHLDARLETGIAEVVNYLEQRISQQAR